VRFLQGDTYLLDSGGTGPEVPAPNGRNDGIEHEPCEKLRRRVTPSERRYFVEILIVQASEHLTQGVPGATDVDDDAIRIEVGALQLEVHDIGGAVKALCGTEDRAPEPVGNHDVVAYGHAVHLALLWIAAGDDRWPNPVVVASKPEDEDPSSRR
jgi:hypothetical protein